MNSSFLCVIVIGFLLQVFAQDLQFNAQLWHSHSKKMYEENEEINAYELADSIAEMTATAMEPLIPHPQKFLKDQFHSQLKQTNFKKIDEDKKSNVKSTLPPRMTAERNKAYLVCAERTGVSPNTISRIRAGNWAESDQKGKAWVRCVLMENNLMSDQSVFRLDVAFKVWSGLDKHSLESKIDQCLPNKAMPPVEIAWRFAKCFQKADPENSLF